MPERLVFSDPPSARDALTFAARATRLPDDAVRLNANDGVLAMTAAALAPRGLGDATPTVLAMRFASVDAELVCDLVVTAASLVADPADDTALVLPETATTAAWAGVSPPRSGWRDVGSVEYSRIRTIADEGMAAVAGMLPVDPGADIVRDVRARVWGRAEPGFHDLPAGIAFAAVTLGFAAPDEEVRVLRSGAWSRIRFARGHVLVRGPHAAGLSPVRSTGRA